MSWLNRLLSRRNDNEETSVSKRFDRSQESGFDPEPQDDELTQDGIELVDLDEEEERDEDYEFADLDPGIQARLNAAIDRERQVERAAINASRTKLRESGITFTDEGEVAITSVEQIAKLLGLNAQAPAAAAPAAPAAPAAKVWDKVPDVYGEPDEFAAYLKDMVKEALSPVIQEVATTKQISVTREAEVAVDRTTKMLKQKGFAQVAEHPQFAPAFAEAVKNLPVEDMRDPNALMALAGSLMPFLGPLPEAPAPQRDNKGRFIQPQSGRRPTPEAQARAAMAREGIQSIAPSRGGGRPKNQIAIDDADREVARRLGMTAEEVAMANVDNAGSAYVRYKERQSKGGR